MAGNVNEWTADLFRPMTSVDLRDVDNHELNPYRGNIFEHKILDPDTGAPIEKDSLGRLQYQLADTTETALRDNYKRPEVYNYLDGDKESTVEYRYGISTLISDKARVIKGGSWADRAFWMSPGTRRFLEQDKSSRTIGFRCAMTRTGDPTFDREEGNKFKTKHKSPKRRYK
jgi:formylglycine-generating enzyme required for sulfatase activity